MGTPLSPTCCTFNSDGALFLNGTAHGLRGRVLGAAAAHGDGTLREQSPTWIHPLPSAHLSRGTGKHGSRSHRSSSSSSSSSGGHGEKPAAEPPGTRSQHLTLWSAALPIEAVAVAGASSVVAVLIGHTDPGRNSHAAEQKAGASLAQHAALQQTAPQSAVYEETCDDVAEDEAEQVDREWRAARGSVGATSFDDSLFPASTSRRYVRLYDADSGTLLAQMYFRGTAVRALLANTWLLLVCMQDSFHVVDLSTLRHLRLQTMYRPVNPNAILALSRQVVRVRRGAPAAARCESVPRETRSHVDPAAPSPPAMSLESDANGEQRPAAGYQQCRVAFPQSITKKDGRGVVAVLTLTSEHAAASSAHGPLDTTPPPRADGRVRQELLSFVAHPHPIAALDFADAGDLLATASAHGGTVRLYDAATGAPLCAFQRGRRPARVLALSVSHSAGVCAALSNSGTVHLFDCEQPVVAWRARCRERDRADAADSPDSHSADGHGPWTVAGGWKSARQRARRRLLVASLGSRATVKTHAGPRQVEAGAAGEGPDGAGASAPLGGCVCRMAFSGDDTQLWVTQRVGRRCVLERFEVRESSSHRGGSCVERDEVH